MPPSYRLRLRPRSGPALPMPDQVALPMSMSSGPLSELKMTMVFCGQVEFVEPRQEPPDLPIHLGDRACVDLQRRGEPSRGQFAAERLHLLDARCQRGVRVVEPELAVERLVLDAIQHPHGLLHQHLGGPGAVRDVPEVRRLALDVGDGIDAAGFVESVIAQDGSPRRGLRRLAEVPLADMHRGVARLFQQFRHRGGGGVEELGHAPPGVLLRPGEMPVQPELRRPAPVISVQRDGEQTEPPW